MIGAIVAATLFVASNVAVWLGMDAYHNYTIEQKIEFCIEQSLEQNPKLHANDVRVACETVIR